MRPVYNIVAGIVLVGVWVVLAFVMALPNGWVHVPLAAGVTLISVGIIQTPPAGAGD